VNSREAKMLYSATAALVRRFRQDTRGATAIEYALVACGIGATVAGVIWNLGAQIKTTLYDKLVSLF